MKTYWIGLDVHCSFCQFAWSTPGGKIREQRPVAICHDILHFSARVLAPRWRNLHDDRQSQSLIGWLPRHVHNADTITAFRISSRPRAISSTRHGMAYPDPRRVAEKLVAFYVDEHNKCLPHSAFRGQTPDEMYYGTGDSVPDELAAAREAARQSRMEVNRSTICPICEPLVSIAG